ncbi:MAG: DUF6076 domain-containing protein [Clostridia bacterium]|nr:DUF6076 domain-containing protein [Clostridia bacterium]
MQRTPGLYIKLQNGGIIKRTLVTNKGETVLDATTISAELIWFAELDFNTYLDALIKIEDLAEKTEDDGDPKNYGSVYLDIFDELLTEANELVYDIEAVYPALGSLLRFDLLDHTPKDDGTAMYVYNAKYAICEQIAEPVRFYIQLREVLEDLSFGIPLDYEDKYANLTQGTVTQRYTFTGALETEYCFRSIKNYFQFLLINYLNSNPNVAHCLFCGQYFIPKTRKTTLYCDRVMKNGKTCKEIAPALKHKIAVDTDPVLKAFERTKQKMYKRYERAADSLNKLSKGISIEEYWNWNDAATEARDKYLRGELTAEEALKIIEVND